MKRELSDRDLIVNLHDDNVASFDILYWRYHQAVYRNILKIVRNSAIAEDILQEVFITLWQKRHGLREEQSVSGWLFVVSFNKSVNFVNKLAVQSKLENLFITENSFSQTEDLENQYKLLQTAIEQLSPQKQKVFTLCKIEGKTYDQAAQELNISKHTVKEYLSLSVASVKDYVKQHPEQWKIAGILFFSDLFL